MEKTNTKLQILEAALDLYAVNGYEATSISQIADAVGVRKASLYGHYAGKQDILDNLVAVVKEQFQKNSVFESEEWLGAVGDKSPEDAVEAVLQQVKGQLRYIIHDPHVSKVRKMLVIEQYRNPELAELYHKQSYEDVMRSNTELMKVLIQKGILKEEDPGIMSAQFSLPVSMWIGVCDREPEREEEVMGLVEKHVRQFFRVYQK